MLTNNDLIKIFIPNKKNSIIFTLLLFLAFFFLLLTFNVNKNIRSIILNDVNDKFINRDIIVSVKDNDLVKSEEMIKKIDHIQEIYKSYRNLNVSFNDNQSGFLAGVPIAFFEKSDFQYDINYDYLNKDYIIIPTSMKNDLKIGKEVILKYDNYQIKVIVAGTYDNDSNMTSGIIYTSINTFNKFIEDNNLQESNNSFHVIVDKQINTKSVINQLNDYGFVANLYNSNGSTEINMYNSLLKMIRGFIIVIVIFLFITYIVSINLLIDNEKHSIAILKASGYHNANIFVSLFIMITIFITLIYAFIVFLYGLFNLIFTNKIFNYFIFNYSTILPIYILIILILLLTLFIALIKIKRISIINLISS